MHLYHVKAFAPNPSKDNDYFTYDGAVKRAERLNSGKEFDNLVQGLSDHVFKQTGVRCSPQSFTIQTILLVDDKLPIEF
jgi:hypothetical protein